MLKTRFEWVILIIIVALLGGAWIMMSQESVTAGSGAITLAEAPIVGHPAPNFMLQSSQGEEITLHDLAGQPVVLNFWATWCAPCRVEMPAFQQASVQYNGRAAIIGVNQGEAAKNVADFGAEYRITYPLLLDTDQQISRLYEVRGLPTTLFIDTNGIVREVIMGAITPAVLQDRVERLLAEAGNP
ncbi:MAG TPA: TlpA family protein disulfide reductase [Chloroflexota bacterium]|nr:TlpA family protein disulfide reductase [Chloroflexota bacterium]HUM70857.1 TlpA family protein disulfide reductase [Chloroflexota bacterium]